MGPSSPLRPVYPSTPLGPVGPSPPLGPVGPLPPLGPVGPSAPIIRSDVTLSHKLLNQIQSFHACRKVIKVKSLSLILDT